MVRSKYLRLISTPKQLIQSCWGMVEFLSMPQCFVNARAHLLGLTTLRTSSLSDRYSSLDNSISPFTSRELNFHSRTLRSVSALSSDPTYRYFKLITDVTYNRTYALSIFILPDWVDSDCTYLGLAPPPGRETPVAQQTPPFTCTRILIANAKRNLSYI